MAAHGPWCNARTYRMKCKYCGKTIYYFSCDCGCSVFFDSLGDPWPIHDCIEYRKAKEEDLFRKALTSLNLNDILFQGSSIDIDNNYKTCLVKSSKKKIASYCIEKVNPEEEVIEGIGYLREVKHNCNLFKLFNEEETEINMQTLRNIDFVGLSKITVIEGDIHNENQKSYTGFIETKELNGLDKGDLGDFKVSGVTIFFDKIIWLFDRFDVIDFKISLK